MTRWLIGASIRFRLLLMVVSAIVLAAAVAVFRDMPVDVLPEFSPTQVEVQTEALGLSAAEVEQLLTVPLEADLLNGVPWLSDIESTSLPGVSQITLTFEPGTDELRARQVVNERITQAKALPNVSSPPVMLEPRSSDSRVLMIAMKPSKDVSLIDASVLARYTVRPRLMSVPGVANVVLWGQRDRQLQVQLDPKRLAAAGVSLEQVVQSTGNAMWVSPLSFLEASSPGAGGFVETTNQRVGIQHISPIVSPETLGQVAIEDTRVRLGDVATVVTDHPPLIGDAAADDSGALLLVVEKLPGANTLEVTDGVEEALDGLRPGLTGIELDPTFFRPASYLESAGHDVGWWLLVGALLAMVAVGVLLFSWRAAVISVAAVALSCATALVALHLAGAGVNALVLAGLVVAISVLVDDAVLDVSAVRRRLGEAGPDEQTDEVVARASLDVRTAVLYAGAAGLLAVLPVLVLGGQERALYSPLVIAYIIAVAASTLVALTVTPALCTLLLRGDRPVRADRHPLRRLTERYQGALSRLLGRPRTVLVAAVVVLVLGLAALPALTTGSRLLPAMRDPNLLVEFAAPAGTSLGEVDRITGAAAAELRTVQGVRHVGTQAGRAVFGDRAVDVDASELWVSLEDGSNNGTDYDDTLDKVRAVVAGYPGIHGRVTTYEQRQADRILGERGRDITVRVYGQNQDVLSAKADEIARMLREVPGVVDPRVAHQSQRPTLVVEPDLAAAQRVGIKPGDIRRAASTLVSGIAVGSLFEDQKIFDVVVRGVPDTQHSVPGIQDLLVDTPSGGHVRLGDVAGVRIEPRPTVIHHTDVMRRIDVTASVAGRSVADASADVSGRLVKIDFPLEHHAELLGDYEAGHDSLLRVLAVAIAALALGYLLLQAAAGGWRLAAALLLAVPVALAGSLLAALLDEVVSLGTLAGMLAVLALVLRHSMLYVRRAQVLRAEDAAYGQGHLGPALALRAARERFAPVVTTSLAVALALLPAVVLGAEAGLEIVEPMALAVLGGLVTSAFVALIVVPAVYLVFGAGQQRVPAGEETI